MNPQVVYSGRNLVSDSNTDVRASFIRRTYGHLAAAILAFVALEIALFQTTIPTAMLQLLGSSSYSWLIVLGAFMGISYMADRWAQSDTSVGVQYAGLALYVVAEAIIFIPLLFIAAAYAGPSVIVSAALITLLMFTGLTFVVITTKKDFTFLGAALKISFFVGLGIIVASILFGFDLGLLFSAFMVIVASGSILYNTSAVMSRYRPDQHVAAALTLFASVALLFWYILRIMMGMRRS
jgi:FtsH-binding integral membrane protein